MEKPKYTQKNPFMAKLVDRRKLTSEQSTKDTQHYVVDISGSGLTYTCGDSLGVLPENNPNDVSRLVELLGWDVDAEVVLPKTEDRILITKALQRHFSLANISKTFLTWYKDTLADEEERKKLAELLEAEDTSLLKEYLAPRDLIDVVIEYKSTQCEPQLFIEKLRRLVPRLYSIASSPGVYPNEIHLTVAIVRYESLGRKREGVASTYLAERAFLNVPQLPVFIASSKFGLPEDDSKDLIMVGPGTGIAPFRAFIQERVVRKSEGRLWLFFGDRQREHDYLYGDEIDKYKEAGVLTHLDLAFSRDQDHKIYVQDRMHEHAKELWEWIDKGAYFYVCGDAERMAKDVDQALHDIVQQQGGLDEQAAKDYVKTLKKESRYQRDVY